MTEEKIVHSATANQTQVLEQTAILIHQSHMIGMEKSLWTIYLKSGTAAVLEAHESTLKLWPTCLKSMIQLLTPASTTSRSNRMDFDDQVYSKFVTEHLRQLNEHEQEIQEQLSKKKKQFPNAANRIEEILQTLLREHVEVLRLQYDYKAQLVELNYQESVLENKFLQESPNEQQVNQSSSFHLCTLIFTETTHRTSSTPKIRLRNRETRSPPDETPCCTQSITEAITFGFDCIIVFGEFINGSKST